MKPNSNPFGELRLELQWFALYVIDPLLDQKKDDVLLVMQTKGRGKVVEIFVQGEKNLLVQQKKLGAMVIGGATSKRKDVEPTPKLAQPPSKKKRGPRIILQKDFDDDDDVSIS